MSELHNKAQLPPLSSTEIEVFERHLRDAILPGRGEGNTTKTPETRQRVRYLCAALSLEEVEHLEMQLITQPGQRSLLIQTRRTLDALQALPWAQVAHRAEANDPIAQAWMELVQEQALAQQSVSRLRFGQLLSAAQEGMIQGRAQALAQTRAAWAALTSFGEQLRASLSLPRMALVMGAETSQPEIVGLPAGTQLQFTTAEVQPDGSLFVVLRGTDSQGQPATALDNTPLLLSLRCNGEIWPLATSPMENGRAEWCVGEIQQTLGLPTSALPLQYLHLTIGGEVPQSLPEKRGLLASVYDSTGQPTSKPPARIELWGEPRWEGGNFSVAVAIPALMRAAYPNYRLLLDVAVSVANWQHLGEWPLAEWEEGPRTLTVPCPGCPDALIPFASALRARLQPV